MLFCKHEFGGVLIVATIPITYMHYGFAFPASKKITDRKKNDLFAD